MSRGYRISCSGLAHNEVANIFYRDLSQCVNPYNIKRAKIIHILCITVGEIIILKYRALKEADVILLLGARLNWILHFGKPPRFSASVKIIQVQC